MPHSTTRSLLKGQTLPCSPTPTEDELFILGGTANDGFIMSTQKSDFLHKLEELVTYDILKADPEADCLILDGHAIIQQLPESTSVHVIFSEKACKFMDHVLHLTKSATSIHIVFYKFEKNSIKEHTWVKRVGCKGSTVHAILP